MYDWVNQFFVCELKNKNNGLVDMESAIKAFKDVLKILGSYFQKSL